MLRKVITLLVAFILACVSLIDPTRAQAVGFILPSANAVLGRGAVMDVPMLKGIKVSRTDPFRFDFILDPADQALSEKTLDSEALRLIKYFLAAVTVPEKDLWVNLSPYEKDRVIPEALGMTDMGQDMLAQDYILKQVTSSMIYPEAALGEKFWRKVYTQCRHRFGSSDVPLDAFNKVWIVPEKAVVYENARTGAAYVVESRLKVMLDADYRAAQSAVSAGADPKRAVIADADSYEITKNVLREIVIPELEKEVNEGEYFARLRQIHTCLILASWYKRKLKESIVASVFADKNKVRGIDHVDAGFKEQVYQQYLRSFRQGVYDYVKEEGGDAGQDVMPRRYFSGGIVLNGNYAAASSSVFPQGQKGVVVGVQARPVTADSAMNAPAASSARARYQMWNQSISRDRLKDEAAVQETLEVLTGVLENAGHEHSRLSSARTIKAMVDKGLVSMNEVQRIFFEHQLLSKLARPWEKPGEFGKFESDMRLLTELTELGLWDLNEAAAMLREKKVLESLVDEFEGKLRNNAAGVLERLGSGGLIDAGRIRQEISLSLLVKGVNYENNAQGRLSLLRMLLLRGELSGGDLADVKLPDILFDGMISNSLLAMQEELGVLLQLLIAKKMIAGEWLAREKVVEELSALLQSSKNVHARKLCADLLAALLEHGYVALLDVTAGINARELLNGLLDMFESDTWTAAYSYGGKVIGRLVEAGILDKSAVREGIRQKGSLTRILRYREDRRSIFYGLSRKIVPFVRELIGLDLVRRDEVNAVLQQQGILRNIEEAYSDYMDGEMRESAADLFYELLHHQMVDPQSLRVRQTAEVLRRGLDKNAGWRDLNINGKLLKALFEGGLITRQQAIDEGYLPALVKALDSSNGDSERAAAAEMVLSLAQSGFIDSLLAGQFNLISVVRQRLAIEMRPDIRLELIDLLKELIQAGGWRSAGKLGIDKVSAMKEKVYGQGIATMKSYRSYIKFLAVTKDAPDSSFQIGQWPARDLEDMADMFQAFYDGMARAVGVKALDETDMVMAHVLAREETVRQPDAFLKAVGDQLRAMLSSLHGRIVIKVTEMASVNAALGLIAMLNLRKEQITIAYDAEIDRNKAVKYFEGYWLEPVVYNGNKGVLTFSFRGHGGMDVDEKDGRLFVSLPYVPFKYYLPEPRKNDLSKMRNDLRIADHRKIIVIACPTPNEFSFFIKTYHQLYGEDPVADRPLLIAAFRTKVNSSELLRYPELSLDQLQWREDDGLDMPDMRERNILILNTMGELQKMYGLADVTVLGNDRNIFEPAVYAKPILIFDGDWINNLEPKDLLLRADGARLFVREQLRQLVADDRQREEMGRRAVGVLEAYRPHMKKFAESSLMQVIGSNWEKRKQMTAFMYSWRPSADMAQSAQGEYGGIDLSRADKDVRVESAGSAFQWTLDDALLKRLADAPGFYPVIIDLDLDEHVRDFMDMAMK